MWNTLQLGLMTAVAATLLALCFALIVTRSRLARTPPRRRAGGAADDHAAVRHRPRAHHAVRPLGRRQRAARMGVRDRAVALDLRAARRVARADARAHAGRLPGAGRRRRRASARASRRRRRRCAPRRWTTFTTVTLPLLAPGLVNAFLIVFIESLADFGNPLLLGGNLEVLSVAIYFAIVGVQQDPGPRRDPRDRAARACRSRCSCSSGGFSRGAASSRFPAKGRARCARRCRARRPASPRASSLPWVVLAVVVYAMIFAGGFFEKWGLNHALTLRHYVTAFGVEIANGSIALDRRRVELVHDDADDRRGVGAADRGVRPAGRLSPQPAEFRGQGRLRIRDDALVRDAGHRRRHRLHPGVQRAADRARVYGDHPRRLLRLSRHDDEPARRARVARADRPQPRRGVGDDARRHAVDAAARRAAAASARRSSPRSATASSAR